MANASAVADPDPQPGLAQHDLVAGLESDAARSGMHGNRPTVPQDSGSVRAAVVVDAIVAGPGRVVDMRVPARNALVQVAGVIGEGDVIRPDQPIPAVANLGTPPEIDPGQREGVGGLLRRAMDDRQLETIRSRIRWRTRPDRLRSLEPARDESPDSSSAIPLQAHRRCPPPGRLPHNRPTAADRRSGPAATSLHRTPPRGGRAPLRRRHHRQREPVERKDVSASSCRLHLPFERLDDRMRDRQRLAGACSRHSLRGAVERARDLRFQPACFSQDIHGTPTVRR